jgi:hypothetical protein
MSIYEHLSQCLLFVSGFKEKNERLGTTRLRERKSQKCFDLVITSTIQSAARLLQRPMSLRHASWLSWFTLRDWMGSWNDGVKGLRSAVQVAVVE